ncbi:hypothetical protein TSOC_010767 [Tetrabaena socialis]|uniref:Uncharacterized protein n=1 Tax=Tetrabaena socialis TaxID=47790 RepID=A0A2J7ZSD6_9CHLO|nr:hypothetical protein TSOC_010767 [Tetrabaena socialis]|eukprot:PNH03184.1 hypothetical protein TSOC_010767 [Tetrabaena socialis]
MQLLLLQLLPLFQMGQPLVRPVELLLGPVLLLPLQTQQQLAGSVGLLAQLLAPLMVQALLVVRQAAVQRLRTPQRDLDGKAATPASAAPGGHRGQAPAAAMLGYQTGPTRYARGALGDAKHGTRNSVFTQQASTLAAMVLNHAPGTNK